MQKDNYEKLRKLLFWMFFSAFIILTPIIVFYSLGYKFNIELKRFQKTGAISIKTLPKDAEVYLDGKRINKTTPCVLRKLLPKKYTLRLEKENFYLYEMPVEVKSSFFSEIEITLIPQMRHLKKLKLGFDIYNFFVGEYLLGKRIIAITDKGIYFLDEDFEEANKIAFLNFPEAELNAIKGMQEGRNKFVFWSQNNIWLLDISQGEDPKESSVVLLYSTKEAIKEVFFALKEKYLIIHDGMKIVALDVKNYPISFTIFELKGINSKIFYDSASDNLYIKDKTADSNIYSLFKTNLMDLIHERTSD